MPRRPANYRPRGGGVRSALERERDYDRERRRASPWRNWYSCAPWRKRRLRQLKRKPLCRIHFDAGKTVAATIADHVKPHRGDWKKFIRGELQSLCKRCHDTIKQAEERAERAARTPNTGH